MLASYHFGRKHRRPGVALVKVAICLMVLVGILALNLDGGRMMDERRRAQAAADAAALAAGADLYANYWTYQGLDVKGTAQAAAIQSAALNGYPAGAVTVNIPPKAGTFTGQACYAEVIVSNSLQASFGQTFTGSSLSVGARSVARGKPLDIGIVLLRSSGAGAFTNNSAVFALVNKPLIIDSSDASAFLNNGLAFVSLSRIDVTGGAVNNSLVSISIPIRTGIQPTLDPLASLPVPNPATLTVQSTSPLTVNSVLTTLQPGIYQGGIHITGLSTVVMSSGIYIMQGGGFQVDGLATVAGLGVMIYNDTSTTYASGPISVSALGKVVLTAPLSGTYQGINFFQNRSMTQAVSMTGVGLTAITGVVYAASAPVNLTGSAAVGLDILGGGYVASSLTTEGVGAVTVNLGLNPPRVPDVKVVE